MIELPILAMVFLAMKGHKWAYILTLVYYFVRSFNFYFPDFYFQTSSGLSFSFSINSIGINLIYLILFFLLVSNLKSNFDNRITKISRVAIPTGVIVMIVIGIITPKDSKYEKPSYQNKLTIHQDTTSNFGQDYFIDIPENWKSAQGYKGTSLMAVSPKKDSLDSFTENFSITVYDLNFDLYSTEKVANKLYQEGTSDIPYSVELINKKMSDKFSGFYEIEYAMTDSAVVFHSKMFCKVEGGKAYSIIFTDSRKTFDENLTDVFVPIMQTFEVE